MNVPLSRVKDRRRLSVGVTRKRVYLWVERKRTPHLRVMVRQASSFPENDVEHSELPSKHGDGRCLDQENRMVLCIEER